MTQSPENSLRGNLLNFDDLPRTGEITTLLAGRPGLRIERIISTGQASPPGFWYDQTDDEWVLLITGGAGLEVEGDGITTLAPGDWLLLPAHCRHRVAWTDPASPTVWLAVHFRPE